MNIEDRLSALATEQLLTKIDVSATAERPILTTSEVYVEYKSRKEDITMEWYWFAAIAAALAGLYYWFFVK